jgi:RHS repeat-associated protein
MTSDGLRSFDYDASDRLAQVRIIKDGEAASISYLTNAMGQRVFKGEPTVAQTLPDESTLGVDFVNWLKNRFRWMYETAQATTSLGTAYTYGDGALPNWALLGEYDNGSASGTGRAEYIWLPTDDGAIPVGMYKGGVFYAIHTDHLGTPRRVTDEGNLAVWQWPYNAFGSNRPVGVLSATSTMGYAITPGATPLKATLPATVMNLRYPGQYADSETGEFYNYFRQYDPRTGRYTQADFDPIGLTGGLNGFSYVGGNPLSRSDPQGLFFDEGGVFVAVPIVAAAVTAPAWAVPAAVGALVGGGLLANEIERTANQREVHRVCDEPPPANLDPCELAKWKLTKALQCKVVRQNMADKWFGGTYDRGHAARMSQLQNEIDRLRRAVDTQCKKTCP